MSPARDYAQREDRDAIERRDFPVGRRGYDQAAVDEHLRRVADELETLRGRTGTSSLSAGTSEQVRVILEAAEASAAELRADAARQSSEHVSRVQRVAGAMLDRIDEIERELRALRASAERLTEGLAQLHEQAGELGAMATAVSGTGPTYVFLVMEALIDAAVHLGFARHIAHDLVIETLEGSTLFAKQSGMHPAELRNMVTSPGGTSAAALHELESGRLRTVLSEAVWAAYRRTVELGDQLEASVESEAERRSGG